LCSQNITAQYTIPEIPKEQTSVYDYINLLSSSEKNNLEQKLIRYSDTTSTQIVVVIISSTQGENIAYLGANWLTKWGIGQADKDNGILITLAKNDRKINISTGYGVEHFLTDAMSRRIIERDIIPYFKSNDYPGGINRGVDAIFEVLTGEYKGQRKSSNSKKGFPVGLIIVIVIFIIIISNNRRKGGRNGGKRALGNSILDAIILSNMGRSSSGGFGRSSRGGNFGGGGFGGGFGGGMGGGGGASGSW